MSDAHDIERETPKKPIDPLIGTKVGEYLVRSVLGRGGMGTVYRADDTALGIPVALKAIAPALAADDVFVRRFRTEARAMARVASPHIVRVMALREVETSPGVTGLFIVMEYVDGGDLHARMAGGPMTWEELWPLLRQMLLGLEAAHDVGVVHRDIKPRNVLLTKPTGSAGPIVKLTDFGLARLTDGDATRTQAVAGTLAYMSPEQVRSLPTLDHRSDLFSLGLTAYEALAGRLPFSRDGGDFTMMRAIVEEAFPAPTEFRSSVPPAVAAALMRSLEKDPDRRYGSAGEMREALAAAGDDASPTVTRLPGAPPRPTPPAEPDSDLSVTALLPPPTPSLSAPSRPAKASGSSRNLVLALIAIVALIALAGTAWMMTRQPDATGPSVVAIADAVTLRSEPSDRGGDTTIRGRLPQGEALQAVAQTADADGTRWLKVWHQDSLRWVAADPSQLEALDSDQLPYETYSLRQIATEEAADSSSTEPATPNPEPTAQTPQQAPPQQDPQRQQERRQDPPPVRREPERAPRTGPPPRQQEPVAQEPQCSSDDIARQTTLAIQVQTETDPDAKARLQRELAAIQQRCR